MKLFSNIIYSSILIINFIFIQIKETKSDKSFSSILDFDFLNSNDDILTKYKDFDFSQDKQNIISIQNKMKKVACLNLINQHIKENKIGLKKKLKEAKEENKENYKIFIKNITDICINQITDDEIKNLFNYQNIIYKENKVNSDLLKFNENFEKLLKNNELNKKLKEVENEKNKRYKRIKVFIYFICIIFIFVIIIIIFKRFKKKTISEEERDKKDKKVKSKKKYEKKFKKN